nr:unnamed protein product [Callosobruchus chinensis]
MSSLGFESTLDPSRMSAIPVSMTHSRPQESARIRNGDTILSCDTIPNSSRSSNKDCKEAKRKVKHHNFLYVLTLEYLTLVFQCGSIRNLGQCMARKKHTQKCVRYKCVKGGELAPSTQ